MITLMLCYLLLLSLSTHVPLVIDCSKLVRKRFLHNVSSSTQPSQLLTFLHNISNHRLPYSKYKQISCMAFCPKSSDLCLSVWSEPSAFYYLPGSCLTHLRRLNMSFIKQPFDERTVAKILGKKDLMNPIQQIKFSADGRAMRIGQGVVHTKTYSGTLVHNRNTQSADDTISVLHHVIPLIEDAPFRGLGLSLFMEGAVVVNYCTKREHSLPSLQELVMASIYSTDKGDLASIYQMDMSEMKGNLMAMWKMHGPNGIVFRILGVTGGKLLLESIKTYFAQDQILITLSSKKKKKAKYLHNGALIGVSFLNVEKRTIGMLIDHVSHDGKEDPQVFKEFKFGSEMTMPSKLLAAYLDDTKRLALITDQGILQLQTLGEIDDSSLCYQSFDEPIVGATIASTKTLYNNIDSRLVATQRKSDGSIDISALF